MATTAAPTHSGSPGLADMLGFLLGAAGMFATMYSTQAILPVLEDDFGVTPAAAGLTLSLVVVAVAAGGWFWGPLSDRIGRRRSLVLASALLIPPSLGAALAPTFEVLLLCRALQGLCMPGLLTVGIPYIAEVFTPALGGRAMGYYVTALVAGGLLGRVGVGLATAAAGWRWALGGLLVLPIAACVALRRLPEAPPPERSARRLIALRSQLRNRGLVAPTVTGAALFFAFVGTFSFVTFRLERAPFDYGTEVQALIFMLWVMGAAAPAAGRLADDFGWRRMAVACMGLSLAGVAITLPAWEPTLALGLACVALGTFAGFTVAQLGVAAGTEADRGTASALYFTVYYLTGALAGFVPGLVWQEWRWTGVALLIGAVLAAALAVTAGRSRVA